MVDWASTEFYYQKQVEHTPHPQDDLVALARSVYVMVTNTIPRAAVFQKLENHQLWCKALQLARNVDYEALRDFFHQL